MTVKKYLLLLLCGGGALWSAPLESQGLQELRLSIEHIKQQLHSHATELSLFQERLAQLEKGASHKNLPSPDKSLERRVAQLETALQALVADCKTLQQHQNALSESIASLRKQLAADLKEFKTTLASLTTLFQEEAPAQKKYTVQPGDSLSQIALDHKVDLKTLKNLNHLSSDVIYSGQVLILP